MVMDKGDYKVGWEVFGRPGALELHRITMELEDGSLCANQVKWFGIRKSVFGYCVVG